MRAYIVFLLVLFSWQSASAQTSYDGCIAEVERDASTGLSVAENWRNSGGGLAARHCRALALAALGLFIEAAREVESLASEASAAPEKADLYTQAGEFQIAASDAFAARRLFDQALAYEPTAIDALEGRARAAAAQQDFRAAIADLDMLISLAPGDSDALALRAAARRQSGDRPGALADADTAVQIDPRSAVAFFERGAARAVTGDLDGARRDWNQAEQLDPGGEIGQLAATNRARLPL